MENKENKDQSLYLIHSLMGNTSGSNNTQTLTDILNQTTVKPSNTQPNSTSNQPKKERK